MEKVPFQRRFNEICYDLLDTPKNYALFTDIREEIKQVDESEDEIIDVSEPLDAMKTHTDMVKGAVCSENPLHINPCETPYQDEEALRAEIIHGNADVPDHFINKKRDAEKMESPPIDQHNQKTFPLKKWKRTAGDVNIYMSTASFKVVSFTNGVNCNEEFDDVINNRSVLADFVKASSIKAHGFQNFFTQ